MSEFLTYAQLGLYHILDIGAVDHLFFLVALSAIYRFRDWRAILWVVTAFTVGHSVTLALAVTGVLTLPTATIEFLIPCTIVATCVENLSVRDPAAAVRRRYRPLIAGTFGLIHGAGFANYLKSLFLEDLAVPIFAFNVGIELGQLVALAAIAVLFAVTDAALRRILADRDRAARMRTLAVSVAVGVVASWWAVERFPR